MNPYEYSTWPVRTKDGKIHILRSKNAATAFCAENNGVIAFDQMRAANWQAREQLRLERTYSPLSFDFEEIIKRHQTDATRYHYPHVPKTATADMPTISFTPDHESGVMDRRTIIRPGRYLERYFSEALTGDQIRQLANSFNASQIEGLELKIGNTRADFAFAFDGQDVKSPSSAHRSCMSYSIHDADHCFWELGSHPAEVYAAGDLAIAYYTHPTNPQRVVARTILFPRKKTFSKIYAVRSNYHDALQKDLESRGYTYSTDLTGASLLFLRNPKRRDEILIPFIDGAGDQLVQYEKIDGEWRLSIIEPPDDFCEDDCDASDFNAFIPDYTSGSFYFGDE